MPYQPYTPTHHFEICRLVCLGINILYHKNSLNIFFCIYVMKHFFVFISWKMHTVKGPCCFSMYFVLIQVWLSGFTSWLLKNKVLHVLCFDQIFFIHIRLVVEFCMIWASLWTSTIALFRCNIAILQSPNLKFVERMFDWTKNVKITLGMLKATNFLSKSHPRVFIHKWHLLHHVGGV
jgi:hypothetical protein